MAITGTEGGNDAVLETVARIGSKLASQEGGEAAAAVESTLRELQRVHVTVEVLEATKIGRAVNALRKTAPSEQARQLAAALYTGWKAVADERLRTSRTQQQPPPPKADEGISSSEGSSLPLLPPVNTKQSARPAGELEMATTSVPFEATPEAKLHLREEFGSETIVKKPNSVRVRVISTVAPGKAEQPQPQRRVALVGRTTAATPVPAPASNTARRNGGGPSSNQQQAKCPATAREQGASNAAAAAKRVSPPTSAAPSTTAPPKPVAVGSSGSACKRKAEDATVFDEARLARAGARLRAGYKEVSSGKEKRKIKEIKAIDAQRMEKKARQRRPVQHLRCMAAHRTGTGKQALSGALSAQDAQGILSCCSSSK